MVALALTACAPGRGPGELGAPPAPTTLAPATAGATVPADRAKAAPRWVGVATLSGTGDQTTERFEVAADVVQWRVTATCQAGHVRISVDGDPEPIVDQDCPGRFFGFSIKTGSRALDVRAGGPWEAVVEQQVETPLAEPPLPGMTTGNRLADGSFSGVEQAGSGTATLFRLPGGGRALRLDPFLVTANTDLFVWASEAEAPRTSADALHAPHVQLEALKATAGAQNYVLPTSLSVDRIRSIVIWCEPVRTAYAAAPLAPR
jgi:hypothetical protein